MIGGILVDGVEDSLGGRETNNAQNTVREPLRNQNRAVSEWRRRVKPTVRGSGERPVRMVRPASIDGCQSARAIPAESVRFDEDHHAATDHRRHVLNPLARGTTVFGVVDSVGMNSVETDSTGGFVRLEGQSPAGEQQPTILHEKGGSIVAWVESDAPSF